jgi:uncharacterized protein (TIGR03435 family)
MAIARLCQAQVPAAGLPQFEVASIKPAGPRSVRGSSGGPGTADPGLYRFDAATLLDLICVAYPVHKWQVQAPFALEQQTFDLVARLPASATEPQFREMMRTLLAERFNLKLHIQSKDFPAYELVAAKTGFKLKEGVPKQPRNPEGWPRVPQNHPGWAAADSTSNDGSIVVRFRAHEEPLSRLADALHTPDDLPVVDKTGLSGTYDFAFEYTFSVPHPSIEIASQPSGVPVFDALRDQLGLQLIRTKLPFDILIIDHIDRMPTEN